MPLSDQLYTYLADEEDARVCKDIPDQACREVPGNFFLIFFANFTTKLADSLSNTKIVLPWLLSNVGAPAFFTGLLVPIRESGSLIPQLVIGGVVRRYKIRKWFYSAGCIAQALSVMGMAWVFLNLQAFVAGVTVVALLMLFSLARGFCSVASKDVLGKTIPKTRRGRLSGLSESSAGLLTLGVGSLLAWLTLNQESAVSLLLAAGLFWLIASVIFARVREYPGATEGGGNALKDAFANISILRDDPMFRRFVLVRSLLMSSGLSVPYLVVMSQSVASDIDIGSLGLFVALSGLASLLSGYTWGKFADQSSRRVIIVSAILVGLICLLAAAMAFQPNMVMPWVIPLLFFIMMLVHQGVRLGRKTYVVDLAGGNRRTDYVSVSNSLIGLLLLIAGLVSAAIAQWSIVTVFVVFAIASGVGAVLAMGLEEV